MSAKNISAVSQLRAETLQSRDVVELLADKWRIPILHVLEKRVLRTHELQSAMRQVSPKMLTQTLRGMERDGLVQPLHWRLCIDTREGVGCPRRQTAA